MARDPLNDTTDRHRCFVALELAEDVREAIAKWRSERFGDLPRRLLRDLPIANLHLTLHFLGELPADRVAAAAAAVERAASAVQSFRWRLLGAGCFPGPRRARVVWAGVDPESCHELEQLRARCARELAASGLELERRPFHPHLTVAYVRRGAPASAVRALAGALAAESPALDIEAEARTVALFESELRREGAVHRAVRRVELRRGVL